MADRIDLVAAAGFQHSRAPSANPLRKYHRFVS
jgi:hypothetical protein